MLYSTAKRLVLLLAWGVLIIETVWIALNYQQVGAFLLHYGWAAPLLFFKSFIKQFLVLNLFGLFKVLLGLFWHLGKLLLIKILKTFGIRYGAYFSSRRWRKASQRFRILTKRMSRRQRQLQRFLLTFRKREYALIILAFFPIFILLFLFGIASKMTREAMVKKGSELGVTKVAFGTAKKSEGLIARLRQIDSWILAQIEKI